MNNLLYTYEEVCDLIREKELTQYERDDARDNFLWQFSKSGSSLHVNTIMQSRYVLYANEKDYNMMKRKADAANLGIVVMESKKEAIEMIVSQYEEVASKAILFVRNGNKGLLQVPSEKSLPHVVIFFTNENLDFVLDALATNDLYKKKTVKPKVAVIQKPVVPALSDEDIKNAIPEGSMVSHKKYGTGIVKAVLEGRINVLFEDSVEKIFAAQVCIDKQLLTVL